MSLLTTRSGSASAEGTSDAGPEPGAGHGSRIRVLVVATLGPLCTGYALTVVLLGLVGGTATGARFSLSELLLAAGPGWLAVQQVPVTFAGAPLGVLPLLPTISACLLVARAAGRAALRLGCREPGQAAGLIGAIALGHAVFGTIIAVAATSSDLGDLGAEPLAAFLVPALLSGVSAIAGATLRIIRATPADGYLDPLALRGLRAGALGVAGLVACGALVFLLGFTFSMPTANNLFRGSAAGLGDELGMFLLSLGYLPNAVIGALSFTAGPGFSLGGASVAPLAFTGGPVPGIPLLAGIPERQAGWWPVLLLLPAMVGVLTGWSLRDCHRYPSARLRAVVVAGALAGFACVLLATLAGGRFADGIFDPVTVPAGLLSLAAFCWIALPGGLVAWFAGPRGATSRTGGSRPRAASEAEETQARTGDGQQEDDQGTDVRDDDRHGGDDHPEDERLDQLDPEDAELRDDLPQGDEPYDGELGDPEFREREPDGDGGEASMSTVDDDADRSWRYVDPADLPETGGDGPAGGRVTENTRGPRRVNPGAGASGQDTEAQPGKAGRYWETSDGWDDSSR